MIQFRIGLLFFNGDVRSSYLQIRKYYSPIYQDGIVITAKCLGGALSLSVLLNPVHDTHGNYYTFETLILRYKL